MTSLSALLAMQYRCAPLPVTRDLARWFAGRTDPEAVLELGRVLRHLLLFRDDTMVLRELRKYATEPGKGQKIVPEAGDESWI
jgi:hypothetical protein